MSLLHDDGHGCPVAFRMAPYGDPIHVLSNADPPLHTQHRRLLQSHLSPAAVADLGPAITAIVDEQLTALLSTPNPDVVATFSDPVPARTVCQLVGLPSSDAPFIVRTVSETGALLDGVTRIEGMSQAAHAALELTGYLQHQLEDALGRPVERRDGLLGVFAEAIEAGEVTVGEVRDMLVVLVSAGSETTASLIATAVGTLAGNQELQERLRRDPEGIPAAIEEFLRTDGPFQFHYRWTPADTTLGDTAIPARSRVLLMWAAANRPAPDAPVAAAASVPAAAGDRGPAPHFAFGRGLHFCIGAPIARLEARIALEQLLARTTSIRPDPDRAPTRRPSIFIRRHATLPVLIERS